MDDDSKNDAQLFMKEFARREIWKIWQTGKTGGKLSEEDARLFQVLQEHPQHTDLWDRLHEATDTEIIQGETNLVLHVQFHHVIENQLALDQPPAVRQVLKVLMQKGVSRHEAIHLMAGAVAWETYRMLKENKPYDEAGYIRQLRKLPLNVISKKPGLKDSQKKR